MLLTMHGCAELIVPRRAPTQCFTDSPHSFRQTKYSNFISTLDQNTANSSNFKPIVTFNKISILLSYKLPVSICSSFVFVGKGFEISNLYDYVQDSFLSHYTER